MKIKRGNIYLADLDPAIGSERGKIRPVLVIQNNRGNKHSSTTIIACIKEKSGNKLIPTHFVLPEGLGLKYHSVVMLEQIRVIEKSRIMKHIGAIPDYCMKQIDKKIKLSLALYEAKHKSSKSKIFDDR